MEGNVTEPKITVFTDPSTRRSLDELRDPAVAAELAHFAELYATQDSRRIIYAGATERNANFREALHEQLFDEAITGVPFVRCPGPALAEDSARNHHSSRAANERLRKGPPELGS
jgi:hypothetical protein